MSLNAEEKRTGGTTRAQRFRRAGAVLLISLFICAVWFPIAFSANIRFDTDHLLYNRESALNQYQRENRSGLAFLLNLITANGWDPALSGGLFLLFFLLSCWILCFYLVRFTERKWHPAWYILFVLLYGTSPVWAFQFYFSLQSAPVGFGIMMASAFAGMDARLHSGSRPRLPLLALWEAAALLCNCFLIVIYQSLIIFYLTAAVMLLFCRIVHGAGCKPSMIVLWAFRIILSLAAYLFLARLAPSGASRYLSSQIRWGTFFLKEYPPVCSYNRKSGGSTGKTE